MFKIKEQLLDSIQKLKEKDYDTYAFMRAECLSELPYINKKCINCKNHSTIEFEGFLYHCCNDTWSSIAVGWQTIYSETVDLCDMENGFVKKDDN